MKISLFTCTIVSLILLSCSSTKSYNELIDKEVEPVKLKKDIDFAYNKLKKLHPKLYWYISKEKLDFKIDSLKNTIIKPIKPFEFYTKLTVLSSWVGQGHLGIIPVRKKYSNKELKLFKKQISPFSQFELTHVNNRLFITGDQHNLKLPLNSELVAINDIKIDSLLKKYKKLIASDGFNTTFHASFLAHRIGNFYTNEYGKQEELKLKVNYKNNDTLLVLKTMEMPVLKLDKKDKKIVAGLDKKTNYYSRELNFIGNNEEVAYLKIRNFYQGEFEKFYKKVFDTLQKRKTKNLIIDLRNNTGGRLLEIDVLYSYLTSGKYKFIDMYETTSKTSRWHINYYRNAGVLGFILRTIAAPIYFPITYFSTSKVDNKYVVSSIFSKIKDAKPNAFKGKVYVLINGASFSASSIISSNLKGSKRAYFVGEETGGAYNGTVAGQIPLFKLPNSNNYIGFGLSVVQPYFKSTIDGRGIFPDKEIYINKNDIEKGIDTQLQWILDDITNELETNKLLKNE